MITAVRQTPVLQSLIPNIHDDDIHALCIAGTGRSSRLISGSKDCTVRSHELPLRPEGRNGIVLTAPRERKYDYWITALDVFSDGSWVAASRNGFLRCCDISGRTSYYRGFPFESSSSRPEACKPRNRNRIMSLFCLKNLPPDQFHCLIGYTESFCQFDLTARRVVRAFDFRASQWVYGFCPVNRHVLATIHGANLSLLREVRDTWEIASRLVEKPRVPPGEQIPFISSIFPMMDGLEVADTVSTVALSYFGGRTEILDVEKRCVVHSGHEHTGRVWQSVPFAPHCYASCADDRTFKIWDTRSRGSTFTSELHLGRVSVLCFLSPSRFVAASCPDDLASTSVRAGLYHYDLRQLDRFQEVIAAPPEKATKESPDGL